MTEKELQEIVENASFKYFNAPFEHRAFFNNRLQTTGGRYNLRTHNLDFNPKILNVFGQETFLGIVKHELCHYHLHKENRNFRDGDLEFQELLTEIGGLRYTPSIEMTQESVWRWAYQCKKCSHVIYRKRRFNLKKFVCANCNGHFAAKGRQEISLKNKK